MGLVQPLESASTTEWMQVLFGRFILLNVAVNGSRTSICINRQTNGAAAWRKRENNQRIHFQADSPGFEIDQQTLVLSFDDVNVLANNFQTIFEAIPWQALDKQGNVAVGKIPRDGQEMGELLRNLERLSGEIRDIKRLLNISIDTPIHTLYRSVGKQVALMSGSSLSDYGVRLLESYQESQKTYESILSLRGFGNGVRTASRPGMRGALLRYYMQHNPTNPLNTAKLLNFVDYEIKPLHIAKKLRWNCKSDPRTESIDLLLDLDGDPVITEVKMAGDSFASSAIVQLLYYGAILANQRQQDRINRVYNQKSKQSWLCIIVEERNEAGFQADLHSAIAFLQNDQTRRMLSPFYRGVLVIRIEEGDAPYCTERRIPAFRVVQGGETVVDWRLNGQEGRL